MSKIILKKSSVVENGVPKAPQPQDLEYGELALNYAAGILYYKSTNNQIQQISGNSSQNSTEYLSNSNYRIDSKIYNHTGTSTAIVDEFLASQYRSCRYQVQVTTTLTYHVCEIIVLHNGNNVSISKVNEIILAESSGVFTADILSGQVRLKFTPAQAHETSSLVFTRTLLANTGNTTGVSNDVSGDLLNQSGTEDLMSGTGIVDLMN